MEGMIHIYSGNGKGKTTAVIGLAVRCRGCGKKVLFLQFLKTSISGELASLKKLGIPVVRSALNLGWTFKMDDAAKKRCRVEQKKILDRALLALQKNPPDLIVLDEVLDAVGAGMLKESDLRGFLASKPAETEIAITGRPVPSWLIEIASYYSNIEKIKHPYDNGIAARAGIEK
ncbi:MAG: cob(I)yrinic acid a,c-diamide adenosyltransferase [Termitinemataceae bacterium]|nr:MAG: cob(I)yrinic acid a,c-diamide adenosyltransferase [Termitinemataceae bacterium]